MLSQHNMLGYTSNTVLNLQLMIKNIVQMLLNKKLSNRHKPSNMLES